MTGQEFANEVKNREYDWEHEGLLGYCIENAVGYLEDGLVYYCDVSEAVTDLIEKHPENADAYEQMLKAITGWGFDSLVNVMDREKERYASL